MDLDGVSCAGGQLHGGFLAEQSNARLSLGVSLAQRRLHTTNLPHVLDMEHQGTRLLLWHSTITNIIIRINIIIMQRRRRLIFHSFLYYVSKLTKLACCVTPPRRWLVSPYSMTRTTHLILESIFFKIILLCERHKKLSGCLYFIQLYIYFSS